MKIEFIEAFQVRWAADDKPAQRSAFIRVRAEDGLFGIGEASPMQGGLASLAIIVHDIAPRLIGQDPLDHAVLLDTLFHSLVKLGPEGALTGALAAIDIALWDLKGKLTGLPLYKLMGGAWRTAHGAAILCLDRRQRRPQARRRAARCRATPRRQAGRREDSFR